MSWDFHVGQKVVCVDATNLASRADKGERCPAEGAIYTVRAVARSHDGLIGLRLVEIVNPQNFGRIACNLGSHEWGFLARRFRPVVQRATDISVFTAMLNPSKVEA